MDEQILKEKWNKGAYEVLQELVVALKKLEKFKANQIKATLLGLLEAKQMKLNQIMPVVRVVLTGLGAGPDLMQSMEIIGQAESIKRMEIALEKNRPFGQAG